MNFILFLHVLVSIALIGLILIQHGKGADAGAAFGSGSSSTVFGARGAASFLSRATSILATLFFALSLILYISASRDAKISKGAKEAVRSPLTKSVSDKRPELKRPDAKPAKADATTKSDSTKSDSTKSDSKDKPKP